MLQVSCWLSQAWPLLLLSAISPKVLYDVFLVHAGPERPVVVDSMYKILEEKNPTKLKCFLDEKSLNHQDYSPNTAMQLALETCRHSVVVISKDFLLSRHPRNELTYAFSRRQWIRQQPFHWESLWIILYNITIDDYKQAMLDNPRLPDICSEVECFEFEKKKYQGWTALAEEVKNNILQQDGCDGKKKWEQFLQSRSLISFPRADEVYEGTTN